jgi:hypothetical protein
VHDYSAPFAFDIPNCCPSFARTPSNRPSRATLTPRTAHPLPSRQSLAINVPQIHQSPRAAAGNHARLAPRLGPARSPIHPLGDDDTRRRRSPAATAGPGPGHCGPGPDRGPDQSRELAADPPVKDEAPGSVPQPQISVSGRTSRQMSVGPQISVAFRLTGWLLDRNSRMMSKMLLGKPS